MIEIRKSADRGRGCTSWIEPDRLGLEPGYAELDFALQPGAPCAIATPAGGGGGLAIQQDASDYALQTDSERRFEHTVAPGRKVWVQVAAGEGSVAGHRAEAGDGVAIRRETTVEVVGAPEIEALIFDLPRAGA